MSEWQMPSPFSTEYTVHPDEFARGAEERGFGSVFFPKHITVGSLKPFKGFSLRRSLNSEFPFYFLYSGYLSLRALICTALPA